MDTEQAVRRAVDDAFASGKLSGASPKVVLNVMLTHDRDRLDELQAREDDARRLSNVETWRDAEKSLEPCLKQFKPIAETTWARMTDGSPLYYEGDRLMELLRDIREFVRLGESIGQSIGELSLDSKATRVDVLGPNLWITTQERHPGGRPMKHDCVYLALMLYRYFSVTTGDPQRLGTEVPTTTTATNSVKGISIRCMVMTISPFIGDFCHLFPHGFWNTAEPRVVCGLKKDLGMDAVPSFVLRELQRRVHIADFLLHQFLAKINQKPINRYRQRSLPWKRHPLGQWRSRTDPNIQSTAT